jgi:hypothetical protein
MKMDAKDAKEVLETLAVNMAAESSAHGLQHASRLAKLKPASWQAEVLRQAPDIKTALNAAELRAAMEDAAAAVIFLPRQAAVTAEIIERICAESPFSKMIIWESD